MLPENFKHEFPAEYGLSKASQRNFIRICSGDPVSGVEARTIVKNGLATFKHRNYFILTEKGQELRKILIAQENAFLVKAC